jgi:hypothetical protein
MTKSESILKDIVIQISTRIERMGKHKYKEGFIFAERRGVKILGNILKLHLVTYPEDIQTIRELFNKFRG